MEMRIVKVERDDSTWHFADLRRRREIRRYILRMSEWYIGRSQISSLDLESHYLYTGFEPVMSIVPVKSRG